MELTELLLSLESGLLVLVIMHTVLELISLVLFSIFSFFLNSFLEFLDEMSRCRVHKVSDLQLRSPLI